MTGFQLHLINLVDGQDRTIILDTSPAASSSSTLKFSPDGHYLLVVTSGGRITAVNTQTGHITWLPPSIPLVIAIAIRPTP